MAKNMVRLRTSINSDPEIAIDQKSKWTDILHQ